MEKGSWAHFSSKYHRSAYDFHPGFDELDDEEEDARTEFGCPFCIEDFDFIGLCLHIDNEHPVEAKKGVCPFCAAKVGTCLVGHMTVEHGSLLKFQRRRRSRRSSSGSHSTFSISRKNLREGNLESLLESTTPLPTAPSSAPPDPLLSSFIFNMPAVESAMNVQTKSLDKEHVAKISDEDDVKSVELSPSDEEDKQERAQRSEFVKGLLLSTMFDDSW